MLRLLGRKGKWPSEMKLRLAHFRVVQAQKNIIRWTDFMPVVEGDADRFACELLYEKYMSALDKRVTHGKGVKGE